MRLKSIVGGLALLASIAHPQRPYSIWQINNATVFFDNGECGYVYTGLPHTGQIDAFWRPDIPAVWTWGFTQDGIEYDFVPAPCAVGGI